jgi:hypothetical protein
LTAHGADVRCHFYAGRDHLVCDEELVEAREFIKKALRLKAPGLSVPAMSLSPKP